jgi:hypothetical protein
MDLGFLSDLLRLLSITTRQTGGGRSLLGKAVSEAAFPGQSPIGLFWLCCSALYRYYRIFMTAPVRPQQTSVFLVLSRTTANL